MKKSAMFIKYYADAKYAFAALLPEDPREVILDRPFLYMLIDCEANLPLFIGTMLDMA